MAQVLRGKTMFAPKRTLERSPSMREMRAVNMAMIEGWLEQRDC